jgi:hypothetical protein
MLNALTRWHAGAAGTVAATAPPEGKWGAVRAGYLRGQRPRGARRHLRNHEMLGQARADLRLVEEQRRSEAQLTHRAHHDPLTGLANRTLLRQSLDAAVAHARCGAACAVLYLDLDHFKGINDTLGHPAGDRLLQAVTERIKAEVREVASTRPGWSWRSPKQC